MSTSVAKNIRARTIVLLVITLAVTVIGRVATNGLSNPTGTRAVIGIIAGSLFFVNGLLLSKSAEKRGGETTGIILIIAGIALALASAIHAVAG